MQSWAMGAVGRDSGRVVGSQWAGDKVCHPDIFCRLVKMILATGDHLVVIHR